MYETDPDAKEVIDVAQGLEGLRRQDGIHAAAVVITRDPLTEYLPIQRKPDAGRRPEDAPIVTQYEMHGVEDLGLLKMDFLGLRNLSVIERALDLIEAADRGAARHRQRRPRRRADLRDAAPGRLHRRVPARGRRRCAQTLRSLAPTSFDDVAALVALYRPGPMAANMHRDYAELQERPQGRSPTSTRTSSRSSSDTYGLMIYQESVMRVAQKFAGYTLEEADNLRKACGKKIRALIAAEREKFVAGCVTQGYGEELGTELFDIIEPFADYAFNKSHAYGYGLVAYQTAWLKAHYPVEYLAALLTSVKDNKDKTAVYLAECRSLGIEVLVPDVNRSRRRVRRRDRGGTIGDGRPAHRLRPGRRAQRRARAWSSASWPSARRTAPSSTSTTSASGSTPSVLNKRTMESLIKAGAFDSLGHPRQGLCLVFEEIVDRTLERRREHDAGIIDAVRRASKRSRGDDPGLGGHPGARSPTPSSTRHSGSPSRRRCSASTSATTP